MSRLRLLISDACERPARRTRPVREGELCCLCLRRVDRPSLFADSNRPTASRRGFRRLCTTVEIVDKLCVRISASISCGVGEATPAPSDRCSSRELTPRSASADQTVLARAAGFSPSPPRGLRGGGGGPTEANNSQTARLAARGGGRGGA